MSPYGNVGPSWLGRIDSGTVIGTRTKGVECLPCYMTIDALLGHSTRDIGR